MVDFIGSSLYDLPGMQIRLLFRGHTKNVLAPAIVATVNEMRDYWPLTVRQLYYQLVSKLIIKNNIASYQKVSRVCTTLRRNDLIPWDAVEDRTRRTIEKRGISDVQAFVSGQMESFLDYRYYHRCYVQNQDKLCRSGSRERRAILDTLRSNLAILYPVKHCEGSGISHDVK